MLTSTSKRNRLLKIAGGMIAVGVLALAAFNWMVRPWYLRWGATDAEIATTYIGDELLVDPVKTINHAVTINASPEQIYPWLVQLGADKAGLYSYTWLEALISCPQTNADDVHPKWQDLSVGDEMLLCPKGSGPPPYIIARIEPNQAIVMGHQENEAWVDVWQFILVPQADATSRLIVRTRTMMDGGFWSVIEPGVFIMERGMMLGIKERAETLPATAR